ncbi:MAG: TetR/AcrR family transcriptional regulator [Mycobacteriaceae bacterium]
MPPKSIPGKTSRPYRSELRRQQAEQTRTRIVAAAAELFAAEGYARTTLAKIADAAGVSALTVQGHGPKTALLIAANEYAAVGVIGEENILDVEAGRTLLAVHDREEALDSVATFITGLHERSAHLTSAVIAGAGSDPELDRYLTGLLASINLQIRRVLEVYRDRGWVRSDVPFEELVETAAVLLSVDTFLRITHRDGWSVAAYRTWIRRMLAETVFHRPLAN